MGYHDDKLIACWSVISFLLGGESSLGCNIPYPDSIPKLPRSLMQLQVGGTFQSTQTLPPAVELSTINTLVQYWGFLQYWGFQYWGYSTIGNHWRWNGALGQLLARIIDEFTTGPTVCVFRISIWIRPPWSGKCHSPTWSYSRWISVGIQTI